MEPGSCVGVASLVHAKKGVAKLLYCLDALHAAMRLWMREEKEGGPTVRPLSHT